MNAEREKAEVVALVADLMFASKIRGAAGGIRVRVVHRAGQLEEAVVEEEPGLVLVDLDSRTGDSVAAIEAVRSRSETRQIPLVAFGSHVDVEAIEAARAAGADQVLARSAFVRKLPSLLSGAG